MRAKTNFVQIFLNIRNAFQDISNREGALTMNLHNERSVTGSCLAACQLAPTHCYLTAFTCIIHISVWQTSSTTKQGVMQCQISLIPIKNRDRTL